MRHFTLGYQKVSNRYRLFHRAKKFWMFIRENSRESQKKSKFDQNQNLMKSQRRVKIEIKRIKTCKEKKENKNGNLIRYIP